MPKHGDEHGMKATRSKKSDKAKRSFELHGTYSSKHLRLREAQALECHAAVGVKEEQQGTRGKKGKKR